MIHGEDRLGRRGKFDSASPGSLAGLTSSRSPICTLKLVSASVKGEMI